MNSKDTSFIEQMETLQNQYYKTHTKNTFFKSDQKMECAATISQQMDITQILSNTVYIIGDTNRVFFDYNVFKLYANPSNYILIIQRTLSLFYNCIQKYGNYETHINVNTFSISAAHRYKDMIHLFMEECFKSNIEFSNQLINMYIYNTPNMADNISAILLPLLYKPVQQKIILISKQDSAKKIEELFSLHH